MRADEGAFPRLAEVRAAARRPWRRSGIMSTAAQCHPERRYSAPPRLLFIILWALRTSRVTSFPKRNLAFDLPWSLINWNVWFAFVFSQEILGKPTNLCMFLLHFLYELSLYCCRGILSCDGHEFRELTFKFRAVEVGCYIRCHEAAEAGASESYDRPRDIGRSRSSTFRYLRYLARLNDGAMSNRASSQTQSRDATEQRSAEFYRL